MAQSAKFPLALIKKTARELRIGEKGVIQAQSVKVDMDRHAWVDPCVEVVSPEQVGRSYPVMIERLEHGLRMDLSKAAELGLTWDREPAPEPSGGIAWILVVEIVGVNDL